MRCDDFRRCKQMKITQMQDDLRIEKIQTNEKGGRSMSQFDKVQISDRESQVTRRYSSSMCSHDNYRIDSEYSERWTSTSNST